jgi:hypothetical protein
MTAKRWLILVVVVVVALAIFLDVGSRNPTPRHETTVSRQPDIAKMGDAQLYPDPRTTPGAINLAVTQSDISETICKPGWTRTIRPTSGKMRSLKAQMMKDVGSNRSPREYELDHFISLELGGCPDCITNLWLEPYGPEPGARQKDVVENYLHSQICAGSMTLDQAQTAIRTDWYKVYLQLQNGGAIAYKAAVALQGPVRKRLER